MNKFKRVKPGEPITASAWNAALDALEKLHGRIRSLEADLIPKFLYGILEDDISPDAGNVTDVQISRLSWDKTNEVWIDNGLDADFATDALNSVALSDERHLFRYDAGSGRNMLMPHTAIHLAKTIDTIPQGGSGKCDIYRGDETDSSLNVTAKDWLMADSDDEISPDTNVIVYHQRDTRDWRIIGIPSKGSSIKPFVRCTVDNALTTSEATNAATITHQWGPGTDNTSTAITVHNLLTSTGGVYLFEGDSGDAFLAVHDKNQDYILVNGECP